MLGVVTKPDTLTSGATSAREKWKKIFEGDEHRLLNGYYCVRLPDDDERSSGISRAEAEQKSKQYLDSTAPWSQIQDRGRFGVQNLIKDVSKLLMQVIEDAYVYQDYFQRLGLTVVTGYRKSSNKLQIFC
jgi:hypothetical protein